MMDINLHGVTKITVMKKVIHTNKEESFGPTVYRLIKIEGREIVRVCVFSGGGNADDIVIHYDEENER